MGFRPVSAHNSWIAQMVERGAHYAQVLGSSPSPAIPDCEDGEKLVPSRCWRVACGYRR